MTRVPFALAFALLLGCNTAQVTEPPEVEGGSLLCVTDVSTLLCDAGGVTVGCVADPDSGFAAASGVRRRGEGDHLEQPVVERRHRRDAHPGAEALAVADGDRPGVDAPLFDRAAEGETAHDARRLARGDRSDGREGVLEERRRAPRLLDVPIDEPAEPGREHVDEHAAQRPRSVLDLGAPHVDAPLAPGRDRVQVPIEPVLDAARPPEIAPRALPDDPDRRPVALRRADAVRHLVP